MSRLSESLVRLALASCAVMGVIVFAQPMAAMVLGVLIALSLLPLRGKVDWIGQVIFALAALALAWIFVSVIGPVPARAAFDPFVLVRAVLATWALATAATRLFISNAVAGPRGTVALMLIAVLAYGGDRLGAVYVGFVGLFFALALAALSNADQTRPRLKGLTTRRVWLLLGALVAASAIAGAFVVLIPKAYAYAVKRFESKLLEQPETAFGVNMELGALESLLQSDAIVLRVRGGHPVYLRGAVYDRYQRGDWASPRGARSRELPAPSVVPPSARVVQLETVGGRGDRYFVPLGATSVFVEQGTLRTDALGLYYPGEGESAATLGFVEGDSAELPSAPPSAQALEVPLRLRRDLVAIATRWTAEASSPGEKLRAIAGQLGRGYQYALTFSRTPGRDPLLDFLETHRQGHCEYFASALALLARAVGVPTRVIGGYAVLERNTLGGYFIVREKHAHAWVEAWLDGTWVTVDPTPPAGRMASLAQETGVVAALLDVLRGWVGSATRRVLAMTAVELALAVGALIGIWLAVRLVRHWRARRGTKHVQAMLYTDPLPAMVLLLERLAVLGVPHGPSEPLELYAVRLGEHESLGARGVAAGRIIRSYVRYRYGQRGDPAAIAQAAEAWLEAGAPT